MEIHDRHQIEEDFLQWDGGDVSAPHLINRRDLAWIHQAENRRDGWPGTVVWGFWLIACQPLAAHEVSDTVAADRDPFSGQVGDHPPAATAGIPHQGRYPASEVNDGTCPEKPVHLTPFLSSLHSYGHMDMTMPTVDTLLIFIKRWHLLSLS